MTLPQRIKPRKTYPVGKAAREDLQTYLSMTGQSEAWKLLISGEYRDYDWTEFMDKTEVFFRALSWTQATLAGYTDVNGIRRSDVNLFWTKQDWDEYHTFMENAIKDDPTLLDCFVISQYKPRTKA